MSILRFFKLLSNNNNEATYTEEASKVSLDVRPTSTIKDINNRDALWVISTTAAPTDIFLDNDTVAAGSPNGTVVGTLTNENGLAPYTYTIINDPDNKFDINNDDLIIDNSVDDTVDPDHDVTIRITDDKGNTFDKLFTITVTPAPTYSNDFSLSFNGVDEYVSTGFDFSGRTVFTVNTYMYRASTADRLDVSQSDNANSNRVKILRNNNGNAIVVLDGSVINYSENSVGWKMLTLVYDGSLAGNNKVTFYIDGVPASPASFAGGPIPAAIANNPGEPFNLGFDNGANIYSDGNIDETSIFNVALNQTEVTELYNSGTPLDLTTHSRAADLLSWWRMGEQLSGTSIPDQIGSNDGTLINMNSTNRDINTP